MICPIFYLMIFIGTYIAIKVINHKSVIINYDRKCLTATDYTYDILNHDLEFKLNSLNHKYNLSI